MSAPANTNHARRRSIVKATVFMLLVAVLLMVAGTILKPTRDASSFGGPWSAFKLQPKNTIDVMFFGTSHAFTSVDPSTIWREQGVPTFVLAGPTQRMHITRYYLAEALRTQTPKVVAIEMVALTYPEDRFDEKFHLLNVGYMPASLNRLKAAVLGTPWGHKTGVLFDLWAYHGRWTELKPSDFDIVHKQEGHEYLRGWIPLAGNHKEIRTKPQNTPQETALATVTPTYAYNLESLRIIAQECERRDIELLLFLTPTGPPGKYSQALSVGFRELGREFGNVHVLDLSQPGTVRELDYATDFYDGGHPNHVGAEKTSRTLANYLVLEFGLEDRREQKSYATWDKDATSRDAWVTQVERKAEAKAKAKRK